MRHARAFGSDPAHADVAFGSADRASTVTAVLAACVVDGQGRALSEDEATRENALRHGSAPELFLVLYATAVEDGPAALARVDPVLNETDAERRLAAVFFLTLCPGPKRAGTAP